MRSRLLAQSRCLLSTLLTEHRQCAGGLAAQAQQVLVPSCSPRCEQADRGRPGPGLHGQTRNVQAFARIAETEEGMTKISGYYAGGFYINNVQIPGSIMACRDLYTMWRPRRISELTPDSLVFLEILKPAPEVLVLGTGASPQPLPVPVRDYLQRIGMRAEVLDSRNAVGYFNVLNDEGRAVVGALLVCDPDARMPEVLPESKEPMWDRQGLMQRSGIV